MNLAKAARRYPHRYPRNRRQELAVKKRQRATHKQPIGTAPKHDPIAPFIAMVLLTGMRVGEAAALDGRAVDLKALDHEGREVGEIYLGAASTKTKRGRTIGLEVSPARARLRTRCNART